MTNRSIGTLSISLIAKLGGFNSGMDAAERKADKTAREIARKQKLLAKQLDDAAKGIGVAFGASVAALGDAFAGIDRQIKNASVFKDLEETTGASAESIASLSVAAETAGVAIDEIAGNSIRLTKNLTGVDDESKAAGAGIKALGLNLAEFQALDPVARIDALTKAFGNFKDGPEKAAVATTLWGKSGAEMLKVLKALEEQGGRTKILTQEQIEAADAYADAQAKAGAELKLYAQAASTQAAPAFLALTNAATDFIKELIGLDKETGKLAQSSAMKDFATDAVKAIGFVVDAGDGVIRVFKGIGLSIGAAGAAAVSVASGEFKQAKSIITELLSDLDALASRELFSSRLEGRLAQAGTAPSVQRDERPRLNYKGPQNIKQTKTAVDEVAKALADLEEELALFGQDESFVKAFKFEKLTDNIAAIERYRDILSQLDQQKAAQAITDTVKALEQEALALSLTNDELKIHELLMQGASAADIKRAQSAIDATNAIKKQKDAEQEIASLIEQARTPLEKYEATLKRLNELREMGLPENVRIRWIFKAQEEFDEATKEVKKAVDELSQFTIRAAENIQDQLANTIEQVFKGNFKDIDKAFADLIIRMAAQATAAQLGKALFGDFGKSGEIGGIFGDIGKWFKSSGDSGGGIWSSLGSLFSGFFADGGYIPPGQWGVVGENGPEPAFGGKTGLTVTPNQGQRPIMVTNNFTVNGQTTRESQMQIAAQASRALALAARRNG